MSTLRERKAVANFAAAAAAADASDAGASSVDAADAALAAAARSASAAAASAPAHVRPGFAPAPRQSCCGSFLRLLPFVLLFLAVFIGLSYVSTGTPHYGLAPVLRARGYTFKSVTRQLTRFKVALQEFGGLRQPRAANQGYGGVTKSKKKDKASKSSGGGMPNVGGGKEPVYIEPRPKERDPKALYLTPEQLALYNGDPANGHGTTILLSIHGRIFDVSSGPQFYGPEGNYYNLAAKDASRAFVTNCYLGEQLWDLRGFTKDQMDMVDSWYDFYNKHEVYRPVGWLIYPELAPDAPLPNDEC